MRAGLRIGPRRALAARMTTLLMAAVLFAGAGFEVLLTTLTWDREYRQLDARVRSLARLVAERATTPVVVNDRTELEHLVRRALIEPDLRGAAIYPERGPVLARQALQPGLWEELGPPGAKPGPGVVVSRRRLQEGDVLDAVAPIVRGTATATLEEASQVFGFPAPGAAAAGGTLGWVRLVVSTEPAHRAVATAAEIGLLLLVLALVLGYFAVSMFVRVIIRPLREASDLAREIASGQLERRLPVRGSDELGDLAGSMNTMAAALQAARRETESEAAALRTTAAAVLSLARAARVAHDPGSIFENVAQQVKRVTRAQAVALAVPTADSSVPVFDYFDPPAPWAGLDHGRPVIQYLLDRLQDPDVGAARLEPDPGSPCVVCREMAGEGLNTGIALPLQLPGSPPAVLLALSDDPEGFPPREVDVVVALASHLSAALHVSQLETRLESTIEELRRTHDYLVQSEMLRVAGEMAAGVAHDFNNVLGAILGRTQLLARKLGAGSLADAELRSGLEVIERAAQDGRETGRRLRQFGQASRPAALEPVDLHVMLQDAIEFTRPRWEDEAHVAGHTIEVSLDSRPGAWVAGRANELREVFTNLILNAVDALPRGGAIRAAARVEGAEVLATVADDGVGMDEEAVRRVFEPFFTTKGEGGTGLGMSVVYGIVQRHGGRIEVASRPGAGTRLDLAFPLAEAPAATAVPVEGGARAALEIMVVDDEEAVRDVMRDIAVALGQRVRAFGSGAEALEALRPGAFQLVITDLGMPGMTGWELASRVRALDPEVTIAFVTGWGDDVDRRAADAAGADLVLSKPFTIEDVERVIRFAADRTEGRKAA